jgi:hypothetical protein
VFRPGQTLKYCVWLAPRKATHAEILWAG